MKIFFLIMFSFLSINSWSQKNTGPLKVGDKSPLPAGYDMYKKKIDASEILKTKKILLVFYRGNWCPHCKKHLSSLQEHLKEFEKKNVFVMVVTPETVEKTIETAKKLNTTFAIIHDTDNKIMNDFKVAFEVNEENVPNNYKIVSKKVLEYNVENNNVLPVPATFLIGRDGRLLYVQYDPNYKNRSDFDEILKSF